MAILFLLTGIILGSVQTILTYRIIIAAMNGDKSLILPLIIKILVYVVSVYTAVYVFDSYLLYIGIGYSVGMIAAAIIKYYLINMKKGSGQNGHVNDN